MQNVKSQATLVKCRSARVCPERLKIGCSSSYYQKLNTFKSVWWLKNYVRACWMSNLVNLCSKGFDVRSFKAKHWVFVFNPSLIKLSQAQAWNISSLLYLLINWHTFSHCTCLKVRCKLIIIHILNSEVVIKSRSGKKSNLHCTLKK